MSEEVKINVPEFDSTVNSLQSAVEAIDRNIKSGYEFDKTNIKPFTEDLDIILEALDLLDEYKQMFLADIKTLEGVGDDMVENDEQLAQKSGPQPIQQ